jgi:IPT/TIG domain
MLWSVYCAFEWIEGDGRSYPGAADHSMGGAMSTVTVGPLSVPILDTPEQRAAARMRLDFHRSVLEQNGIRTLSDLGILRLSGAVAARPGIVVPLPTIMRFPPGPIRRFPLRTVPVGVFLPAESAERGAGGTTVLRPGFVEASVLPTVQDEGVAPAGLPTAERGLSALLAVPPVAAAVTIAAAYFVAQTVELADDAVVVLQQPHQYLTFIAERITVGRNVTFTYERPTPNAPVLSWAPGDRPAKPPKAPTPDGLWGVTGDAGGHGAAGGAGWAGVNAPEVELWVLELNGSPLFDLRGQDGGPGGRGRDGGDGGDGSDGRAELYDWLGFCKSGAGWGGDGGPGGNGGPGGAGGAAGHGGRLSLYAPAPVLQRYAAGGFSISTDGGAGGHGGGPGAPGAGGAGGRLGARPKNCAMSEERHDGAPGPQGQQGATGSVGPRGAAHPDAVRFVPVDEDEFQRKLTQPALVNATPARGVVGTPVTLNALRLTGDDVLLIDDAPVPMTVVADTLATFTVPAMRGGFRVLTVRRVDGATSNRLSFYVLPQVTAVGDGSRIKPGSTVTVTGSGFAEGARVRVNGEDMPDAQFVNASTMTFTLQRPQTTLDNPDGEAGDLQVVLADGTPSNTRVFIIDTLRILVLGDSVAWGQGLQQHEKYATIVERALAAVGGGIKSYTTILAHSGATIGVGDTTVLPALPGRGPHLLPDHPAAARRVPRGRRRRGSGAGHRRPQRRQHPHGPEPAQQAPRLRPRDRAALPPGRAHVVAGGGHEVPFGDRRGHRLLPHLVGPQRHQPAVGVPGGRRAHRCRAAWWRARRRTDPAHPHQLPGLS